MLVHPPNGRQTRAEGRLIISFFFASEASIFRLYVALCPRTRDGLVCLLVGLPWQMTRLGAALDREHHLALAAADLGRRGHRDAIGLVQENGPERVVPPLLRTAKAEDDVQTAQ